MNDKKYVVLEHLCLPYRGFRFWTTNSENNTHSFEGELWYKEVLFTNDTEEAILESGKINSEAVPRHQELEDYHKEKINKL